MPTALPPFPSHKAFAGLGAHFAKLIDAGDVAALTKQARLQATELKRQWRVADNRDRLSPVGHSERKTILARMTRDKVDAADLLALISWLEQAASPERAALDASLSEIASRTDIAQFLQAAE